MKGFSAIMDDCSADEACLESWQNVGESQCYDLRRDCC